MKRKIPLIVALLLLSLGLGTLLCARPVYNLYRDISFYWEERSPQEHAIKAFAEENNISYGEYPQDLIDLYIQNQETRDFVLNFPFRQEAEPNLAAYAEPDTVPLFLQWDPLWGYEKYGSSYLAVTGCGPTCLAMVGYYLTGDANMTPHQIAKFAQRNGYYAPGYGSSWTLVSEGSASLGLKATELPLVKQKMVSALEAGSPIILAMGAGDFTSSGHYIVLTEVVDGAFRVNDPNSRIRSEKLWSYEELEGQIRNIWAISAA